MTASGHDVTLHRLCDDAPGVHRLAEILSGDVVRPGYEDADAVAFHWLRDAAPVAWAEAAAALIGPLPDEYKTRECAALLHITVDGERYVIGFGSGSRKLDQYKDPNFGLRFVVRAVDAKKVQSVSRRSMTGLGRQDHTRISSGAPIGHVGVTEYAELVGKLAGLVDGSTLGLAPGKPLRVEGASGLRLRIPLDRDRLVALLRRVSEICARDVQPEFAFVEAIVAVKDKELRAELDAHIPQARNLVLGDETNADYASAVPLELADQMTDVQGYTVTSGPITERHSGWPQAGQILDCCSARRMSPAKALREATVTIYEDDRKQRPIAETPAIQWMEASVLLADRRFFLVEGDWYEGGTAYFTWVQQQVAKLFKAEPSVVLPPWADAVRRPSTPESVSGERIYNEWVEDEFGPERMLKLDRKGVSTELHGRRGFEPCDLLGPGGELIHVKAGSDAGPFSHMASQALVSTEALCVLPGRRKELAELVQTAGQGRRTLPQGWFPTKVILAMMVDRDKPLSPDSLFPNTQIVLAGLSRDLRSRFDVEVEIVAIPRDATVARRASAVQLPLGF